MQQAILELRGVSRAYPEHRAVDGVSLAVPQGSLFSLVGPSGCGKTTTLRLVAGFERPDAGDILLNGARINDVPPYERNVSTVFQNYALFPHLNVFENVAFGLRRRKAAGIAERVAKALELVRLTGKEKRSPAQLSGGERQRVALARSLVIEPDVLLLDEPLAALDPALRKRMRQELKDLQRRVGITFLFVTHDQEEALVLSDRIAIMNQGRIEQVGSPQDVYLRPQTRFVASFVGAINWIGDLGVRPESVRLSREAPSNGARVMPAVVRACAFTGSCFHVDADVDRGSVLAEVPREGGGFDPGERVYAWWHVHDELAFPRD